MRKVIAYACDYCGKPLKTPKGARVHEAHCLLDPKKKACKSCGWWFKNNPGPPPKLGTVQDNSFCYEPSDDWEAPNWNSEGEYMVATTACERWTKLKNIGELE